jgi:hypothetical protein
VGNLRLDRERRLVDGTEIEPLTSALRTSAGTVFTYSGQSSSNSSAVYVVADGSGQASMLSGRRAVSRNPKWWCTGDTPGCCGRKRPCRCVALPVDRWPRERRQRNRSSSLNLRGVEGLGDERNDDPGGWSGGPVFRYAYEGPIERMELVGVIYEFPPPTGGLGEACRCRAGRWKPSVGRHIHPETPSLFDAGIDEHLAEGGEVWSLVRADSGQPGREVRVTGTYTAQLRENAFGSGATTEAGRTQYVASW